MQMFSILNEINDNSHWNTTSVVFASIGSAAGTYILVAITGYLSFGNSVGPNIVGMYPPGLWATIGRAAIVILVMFSYPLQVHPCRASADAVLRWRPKSSTPNGNDGSPNRHPLLGPRGNRAPEPMSDLRFWCSGGSMVWHNCWIWSISSITMCSVFGERLCVVFRPVATYLPKCVSDL